MQRERRTSVGCPLPDYVQYRPGLCPQAEEGARWICSLWPHPLSTDPERMRQQVRGIAEKVRGGG